MPKSRNTRKSNSRSSSGSHRSTRKSSKRFTGQSLTLDERLNIVGVALAVLGALGLLAPFTDKNGPFTGWIAQTTGRIAGWGGIIIPLILVIGGITLLLRRYERLPRVSGGRIAGILLLYLNILTWFHFFTGGGFSTAKLGRGGGYLGAAFDVLLSNGLGRAGEVVVLVAWLLIAVIFLTDISLPELLSRIVDAFGRLKRKPKPAPVRQPSFSFDRPRSVQVVEDNPLPDGFRPLTDSSTPDRASLVRQRREVQKPERTTPVTEKSSQAEKTFAQTVPLVHSGVKKETIPWLIPAVADILDPVNPASAQTHYDKTRARIIEDTLASFGSPGHIVEIHHGPAVTQFGVEPDFIESRNGKTRVRVAKIVSLADDLALALAAPSIRIQAPVPGKAYVGIEVPNSELTMVTLRELIETEGFKKVKSSLRFAFGKDVAGKPIFADLPSMPHLLIAGTTNSGKSVLVNAILTSLLLNNSPADLRLVLVDPKRVELTGYNGIPHLLAPVVVDADRVVGALQWMLREMDSRYKRFAAASARNIIDYNAKSGDHLPYLVVVIDELADLMLLAPEETERSITRLAQLARATGIHLILSTQRPSVDVLTGLIKANFPARVAFMVFSGTDSRVILDQTGAERLLGKGDMLYQAPDAPAPVRLQGVYVSDGELQRLVEAWRQIALNRRAQGVEDTGNLGFDLTPAGSTPLRQGSFFGEDVQSGDPLLAEAADVVRREGKGSISMLQRRLRVGYNRAARLIDALEDKGIIGPQEPGSQVREVLDYGSTSEETPEEPQE